MSSFCGLLELHFVGSRFRTGNRICLPRNVWLIWRSRALSCGIQLMQEVVWILWKDFETCVCKGFGKLFLRSIISLHTLQHCGWFMLCILQLINIESTSCVFRVNETVVTRQRLRRHRWKMSTAKRMDRQRNWMNRKECQNTSIRHQWIRIPNPAWTRLAPRLVPP